MKRIAWLPIAIFGFACGDSALVQPQQTPEIAADHDQGRDPRVEYTFQLRRDESLLPQAPPPSANGDFLTVYGSNGFFVEGQLEGYAYITGQGTLNQVTGDASGSGSLLLIINDPGFGAFTCSWRATWENFFAVEHGEWYGCEGSGDFKGQKLWSENNNERDPSVNDAVAVLWGRLGPRDED